MIPFPCYFINTINIYGSDGMFFIYRKIIRFSVNLPSTRKYNLNFWIETMKYKFSRRRRTYVEEWGRYLGSPQKVSAGILLPEICYAGWENG